MLTEAVITAVTAFDRLEWKRIPMSQDLGPIYDW